MGFIPSFCLEIPLVFSLCLFINWQYSTFSFCFFTWALFLCYLSNPAVDRHYWQDRPKAKSESIQQFFTGCIIDVEHENYRTWIVAPEEDRYRYLEIIFFYVGHWIGKVTWSIAQALEFLLLEHSSWFRTSGSFQSNCASPTLPVWKKIIQGLTKNECLSKNWRKK